MHQHPTLLGVCNGTVLTDEPTAAALVVNVGAVESNVDGVDGGVVVRSQRRLSVRSILDHEHVGLQRLLAKGKEGKLVST
jgi:hypothetical protein